MEELIAVFAQLGGAKLIALGGLIMWIDIRSTVKEISKTLIQLSNQLSIVVERVDGHEKRIDKLENI